jgi:hypothetical protein
MKTVTLKQAEGSAEGIQWTVTVFAGGSEVNFTVESATHLEMEIPCDSLQFERSGVSPVTVTPDPAAVVILNAEPYVVHLETPIMEQALFGGCIFFWSAIFFCLWR